MLTVKADSNFPEEISYHLGSKEVLVRVPEYQRNDGKPLQEPVLVTLGGKQSVKVNKLA